MSIFDELYQGLRSRVRHSVWVLSDLQQSLPNNARKCLDTSISDFVRLGCPAEQIWYLGDSVEGTDLDHLWSMARMQEEAFGALKLPLYYTLGNHDFDYARTHRDQPPVIPFYETVRAKRGWHTIARMEDFHFTGALGPYRVYFLSDHIASDNSWATSHAKVVHGEGLYPYTDRDAAALRSAMEQERAPVITAAHYAFPGGNRDTGLTGRVLPLPQNVRLHLYGHSHIGDLAWGKKNAFRRICWVDWQDIPQIDVASLENIRGQFCRSVLLQVYDDGRIGLFFRNHDAHRFMEAYFPNGNMRGEA